MCVCVAVEVLHLAIGERPHKQSKQDRPACPPAILRLKRMWEVAQYPSTGQQVVRMECCVLCGEFSSLAGALPTHGPLCVCAWHAACCGDVLAKRGDSSGTPDFSSLEIPEVFCSRSTDPWKTLCRLCCASWTPPSGSGSSSSRCQFNNMWWWWPSTSPLSHSNAFKPFVTCFGRPLQTHQDHLAVWEPRAMT